MLDTEQNDHQTCDENFATRLAASRNTYNIMMEDIIERYSRKSNDEGDVINLYTWEVEEDNGHLRSMKDDLNKDGIAKRPSLPCSAGPSPFNVTKDWWLSDKGDLHDDHSNDGTFLTRPNTPRPAGIRTVPAMHTATTNHIVSPSFEQMRERPIKNTHPLSGSAIPEKRQLRSKGLPHVSRGAPAIRSQSSDCEELGASSRTAGTEGRSRSIDRLTTPTGGTSHRTNEVSATTMSIRAKTCGTNGFKCGQDFCETCLT
jgi:hypothetical protein